MRILVTGSSGFIGQHLCQRLALQGHEVVPCSRQNGIDFNQMTEAGEWGPHLENIDAVVNCVGIIVESRGQRFEVLHKQAPIALFKACEQQSIQRVIQVSALGANEKSFTDYQLSKKAADDYLRQSSLDGFILQPSLVYGKSGSSFKLFSTLARLPIINVPGYGEAMVQPVHVADVVEAIVTCLDHPDTGRTLSLVGPQALSYREWLQAIRKSMGKKPAVILPMPYPLLLPMATLIAPLFPILSPDNLKMLRAGNTDAVDAFEQLIQRTPLSVEEGLKQCFT